jgi:hypothetical protein
MGAALFKSVRETLGISKPLSAAVRSKIELVWGVAVLIPTWALPKIGNNKNSKIRFIIFWFSGCD